MSDPNQNSYQQIQLESIALAPDESVADHLKTVSIQEKPIPGDAELLVKLLLSPIHPCDILCAAGLVPRRVGVRDGLDNDQYLPGIEAVGLVEGVGADLETEFEQGQRVFVCCWAPWGSWQEANGVWSEYLLVKKENVIVVPPGISDPTAAMFLVVPVTAYVMMLEELGLKKGDWLIQNAAGSALGRWVIALAKELGINTINLVRRQEQVVELKQACATEHVLWSPADGSRNAELKQEIHSITAQGPIMGALDAVGDGTFSSLMFEVLSRYGTVLIYGVLGGTDMKVSFNATCQIALECLSVKGFSLQNWWLPDTPDAVKSRVFSAVWEHIRDNPALNPLVDAIYPFDRVGEAIKSSLRQKSGKVLLCPGNQNTPQG